MSEQQQSKTNWKRLIMAGILNISLLWSIYFVLGFILLFIFVIFLKLDFIGLGIKKQLTLPLSALLTWFAYHRIYRTKESFSIIFTLGRSVLHILIGLLLGLSLYYLSTYFIN